jgi:hypothetical protein
MLVSCKSRFMPSHSVFLRNLNTNPFICFSMRTCGLKRLSDRLPLVRRCFAADMKNFLSLPFYRAINSINSTWRVTWRSDIVEHEMLQQIFGSLLMIVVNSESDFYRRLIKHKISDDFVAHLRWQKKTNKKKQKTWELPRNDVGVRASEEFSLSAEFFLLSRTLKFQCCRGKRKRNEFELKPWIRLISLILIQIDLIDLEFPSFAET